MEDEPKEPRELAKVPPAEEEAPPSGLTPDKILFYVIVTIAVIGIGGYFGGRQVWHAMKTKRARAQAALADKYVREQNIPEAQRAIRTAIQMAPNDPQVLRTTATWCSMAGRQEGLTYWDRLFQIERPTRDDLIKKLDLALTLHRLDISRAILKDLLRTNESDREVLVRTVLHHSQTGQPDIAIKAAQLAVSKLPSDPQLQYMLGGLLLESTNREAHREARGVLWNVALGNSNWREPAVDMLTHTKLLNDGDRLLLIRSIEARNPVSLSDRLRVLDLRSAMVSDRSPLWRQADELRAQFPGVTNQFQIARWVGDNGGTNLALAMLPRELAGTNTMAANVIAELFVRWRAWDDLQALVEKKPLALTPSLLDAAQGVVAYVGGRGSDAAGYFANALQKAAARPFELIQVATFAEGAQQPAFAATALVQAAELQPLLTVQLCRRALALVYPIEDLTISRRILERLGDFLPGEPSVLLERSWMDLLFAERIDRARESLTSLLEHPILGEQARVMLVLADLNRGDSAAALSRLESLKIEPETLTPRLQAVCAATLLANEQREPARRLATRIQTDKLRKKELELVAPLL